MSYYVMLLLLTGPFAGVGYQVSFENKTLCEAALAQARSMPHYRYAVCIQTKR